MSCLYNIIYRQYTRGHFFKRYNKNILHNKRYNKNIECVTECPVYIILLIDNTLRHTFSKQFY